MNPTIIPPKTRRAGPDSSVLAGPMKLSRFHPGVGVQKAKTAQRSNGSGNSGQAFLETHTINPRHAKPKVVRSRTRKSTPPTTLIEVRIGFTSQPKPYGMEGVI